MLSFVIRVRDEAATLRASITSLFDIAVPIEIVVVLHRCTDDSKAIALGCQDAAPGRHDVRVVEYDVPISRAGLETLITPSTSPHSLVSYYEFAFGLASHSWKFNWDGDFIATRAFVDWINGQVWTKTTPPTVINVSHRMRGSIHKEPYLYNCLTGFAKSNFWEVPSFPNDFLHVDMPDKAAFIRVSEPGRLKSYWREPPWFAKEKQATTEQTAEAAELRRLYAEAIQFAGPEPVGCARYCNGAALPYLARCNGAQPYPRAAAEVTLDLTRPHEAPVPAFVPVAHPPVQEMQALPPPHLGGSYLDRADPATWMPDIWERLIVEYGIRSAIDVGCGPGFATRWLLDRLGDAAGVEGDPSAHAVKQCDSIVQHDYACGPYQPARTFDLGWSAEFVEHVEEQYIPNWMATLARCKFVCITFATPGQGGYHHVTERDESYWVERFAAYGLEHLPEETARLRATSNGEPYGRKTLTFFRNTRLEDDISDPPPVPTKNTVTMRHTSDDGPTKPNAPSTLASPIPKVIHHIWIGSAFPAKFHDFRRTWMSHHPTWTFVFWHDGDARILDARVAEIVASDRYTPIVKSDVLRLYALKTMGGMYVDTDFECLKPFDALLSAGGFHCGYNGPHDSVAALASGLMACPPNDPLVVRYMDAALEQLLAVGPATANREPDKVTGPWLLTRLSATASITRHARELFYPVLGDPPPPEAYARHHWAGSAPDGWSKQQPQGSDGATARMVLEAAVPLISFVMRVHNEAATLHSSISSLFQFAVPIEIVVVLHRCTDESKAIAIACQESAPSRHRMKIVEYAVPISRAGLETYITPSESRHSLVSYYNFAFGLASSAWKFKWDGDCIAACAFIKWIEGRDWMTTKPTIINVTARWSGLDVVSCEPYMHNCLQHFDKHNFWEVPIFPNGVAYENAPPDAHFIRVNRERFKSYWHDPPWFASESQPTPAQTSEAALLRARYALALELVGPEPLGCARSCNPDAATYLQKCEAFRDKLRDAGYAL